MMAKMPATDTQSHPAVTDDPATDEARQLAAIE
jgi:hypothetical protein